MAKSTSKPVKTKHSDGQIIVNQIQVQQINRTHLDIKKWRNAIRSAESIDNPFRKNLLEIYEDIMLDAHLTSCIEKRKSEICNLDIVFKRDGEPVDEINNLINGPWFESFIRNILDAKFYGFTPLEFINFELDNVEYELIDRRNVRPEFNLIVKYPSDISGWNYTSDYWEPWILVAGEKRDLGLLAKAAPYVIYKRNGFADFAQYCEQYGQPVRIAKYNPYDPDTRNLLQKTLEEAGSGLVLTIPEGTSLELQYPSNTAGSKDLYDSFVKLCDAQISKLFLHETLTTEQGDNGARSLGEVHADVADAVHSADRRFILSVLNYGLTWRLIERGYDAQGGEFSFEEHMELDLDKQIRIDEALNRLGVPLDDEYYYDTYGRPRPEKYDELKETIKNNQLYSSPFGISAAADNGSIQSITAQGQADIPHPYKRPGILRRVFDFFR